MLRFSLLIALIIISCGPDNSSPNNSLRKKYHEVLPSASKGPADYQNGLFVTFKNSLAQYRSDLSVAVCAYKERPKEGQEPDKRHTPCIVADQLIPYQGVASFYLNKEKLDELFAFSNTKKISFRFNDTHFNSSIHWPCWEEDNGTELQDSILNVLHVEATQVNSLSYSCRIER